MSKTFSCPACNKGLTRKASIKSHILTVHEKQKPFPCPVCNKGLTRKASIKSHILTVHEKQRPYKCDVCDRKLSTRSSLKRHKKVKHVDKLFKIVKNVKQECKDLDIAITK